MHYDPEKYWEERLKHGNGNLRSVGHISLPERSNEYAYKAKIIALKTVLSKANISIHQKLILDAGCGIGFYSKWYIDQGAQIVGIDISFSALQYAEKMVKQGKFILSSLSKFDYPSNSFDIIHAFDVLYHIADDGEWEDSLWNLMRLLKNGGFMIISERFPKETIILSHHVKCRSKEQYMNLLNQGGMYIVAEEGMLVLFNRRSVLSTYLPNLSYLIERLFGKLNLLKRYGEMKVLAFQKK